jgi:hypothetical protein
MSVEKRYVIRTSAGNRGPFSRQEISQLVHVGRLQPATAIWDTVTNLAVHAAEVIGLSVTPLPPPTIISSGSAPDVIETTTKPQLYQRAGENAPRAQRQRSSNASSSSWFLPMVVVIASLIGI